MFKKLFDKYRKEILGSRLLMVEGRLQREGEVVHVIVRRCYNQSRLLLEMTSDEAAHDSLLTLSRADKRDDDHGDVRVKKVQKGKVVQAEIFPGGRNFK